ncbi:hypothetical protein [Saccharopolyspora dendranthemae]|uniref:Uncharacterized protein n=1 Tax=Saccharopolyspora dendranthemae TaxID=1181886 RepID=A0A561U2N4_9PSEU|nr:hypothetical protein [Saccharopolyspora dendranthemae]TWF93590.1 hypothetical protein FHU35_15443 [Saccharopolyspora dendranthemae]
MTGTEERAVEAWLDFATSLRLNEGFYDEKYGVLLGALADLAEEWAELDQLPRSVVNVLVDIFPATESTASFYKRKTRQKITEAAFELHEVVQRCVAVREGT